MVLSIFCGKKCAFLSAALGHAHDLLQQFCKVRDVHADDAGQYLVKNGQHQRCANTEPQPSGNARKEVEPEYFAGFLRQADVFREACVVEALQQKFGICLSGLRSFVHGSTLCGVPLEAESIR